MNFNSNSSKANNQNLNIVKIDEVDIKSFFT